MTTSSNKLSCSKFRHPTVEQSGGNKEQLLRRITGVVRVLIVESWGRSGRKLSEVLTSMKHRPPK